MSHDNMPFLFPAYAAQSDPSFEDVKQSLQHALNITKRYIQVQQAHTSGQTSSIKEAWKDACSLVEAEIRNVDNLGLFGMLPTENFPWHHIFTVEQRPLLRLVSKGVANIVDKNKMNFHVVLNDRRGTQIASEMGRDAQVAMLCQYINSLLGEHKKITKVDLAAVDQRHTRLNATDCETLFPLITAADPKWLHLRGQCDIIATHLHLLKLPKLKDAILPFNDTEQNLKAIASFLNETKRLQHLCLGKDEPRINTAACFRILSQHMKMLEKLKALSLMEINLDHDACFQLFKILQKCPRLTLLNISSNPVGSDGLLEIMGNITKYMKHLLLRDTKMDDEACYRIDSLIHRSSNFQTLALAHNNITDDGIRILCTAIKDCYTLEFLELNVIKISNYGVKLLADAFGSQHKLSELFLAGNNLSDEACHDIAAIINRCHALTRLNLMNNQITDGGLRILAESVQIHRESLTLYLHGNNISDSGVEVTQGAFTANILPVYLPHTIKRKNWQK